ncbi:MAG: Ig-like domain-containing protein, partial [Verrucomicrobiota bacterium]|nr:Ig-like domain-containing protein [Verrucomicrobiota bacterium]
LLSFKAKQGASGSGEIEYTIEDALGQRAKGVITLIISGEIESLVDSRSYARGWVPSSNRDDDEWTAVDFDDSNWSRGRNGAGYERSSGYMSLISSTLNFRTKMYNRNETLYLRYTFDVDQSEVIDELVLRMKYDDGFIAYLNGNRVASANAPSAPRWNSGATALHDDQLAVVAQSFDISLYRENLAKGKNVLAIHGLNYEKNSSDMLIVAELVYASGEGDGTALAVCEPPVERTPESILLSGRLVGHQPDSKAFFVWGKTDAGPSVKNWEHSKEIKPGDSGELRHLVDGLAAGAELFYRLYVDGPYGIAWSVDTQRTSTLAKGVLVARPDSYQVEAGEVLRLAKRSEGVQGNDVGVRAATRSLLLAKPKNGRVMLNANGTFTYTPNDGFVGEDHFNYRLSDTLADGAVQKTVVSVGGEWRYHDKATAPNRNWAKSTFDDSDWSVGPGLLGYGNGNEATEISFGTNPDRKNVTAYFRQNFEIEDAKLIDKVTFKLLRDDAAAIYLNGEEIYRDKNLSRTARHTTMATSSIVNESAFATFEIEGVQFVEGKNVIAAEVHQSSRTSSDLSFALFGQAHLIPGSRVSVTVDKGSKTDIIANFNVTENGLEVVFGSRRQKTYNLETSTDLRQWDTVQVIEAKGDKVAITPDFDIRDGARFFRVLERP